MMRVTWKDVREACIYTLAAIIIYGSIGLTLGSVPIWTIIVAVVATIVIGGLWIARDRRRLRRS